MAVLHFLPLVLATYLFLPSFARVVIRYYELTTEMVKYDATNAGAGARTTITGNFQIPVFPTAYISSNIVLSTSTSFPASTGRFDDPSATQVNIYLEGTHLPVTTSCDGIYNPCTFSTTPPGMPIPSGYRKIELLYFTWRTITNDADLCPTTSFSYSEVALVTPPPGVQVISYSTYGMTTNTTTYYNSTISQVTTSIFTAASFWLLPGQTTPVPELWQQTMLINCQDPRGCWSGIGEGCTTTGSASAASTVIHGPITANQVTSTTATQTGSSGTAKSTATSTGAAKSSAGRAAGFDGTLWTLVAVAAALIVGMGLL